MFRLWSTACSAGDEPYTLAIILHHYFIERYPDIQFEILATDIDPNILAKAQKGVYNARILFETFLQAYLRNTSSNGRRIPYKTDAF